MKNKNKNNIVIALIVLGILGTGYFLFTYETVNEEGESEAFSLEGLFGKEDKSIEEEVVSQEIQNQTGDSVVSSGQTELPLTYQNQQFGFELDLPEGYTGSSFTEGEGVTVLLKRTDGSESFQIYIASFDEPESISIDRIQRDVPDLVIENPQNAIIAGGAIEALIFIGQSEDFGKTREVWFVKNQNLYQIIAPFELEQTVGPIVESLRFQ